MIAGARVEVAPYKRNPMDFVLWKPSSDDLPGWDSPWGRGRPGWHIECSAMAHELLGESFDIHGGGNDLMFPHHENEIAQSCCAHPQGQFARYWLHNEMLQVEGKKMSKSLGNFFTVRDLLEQGIPGEVIRFVFLSTHYRKPMDWTAEKAREAEAELRRWRAFAGGIDPMGSPASAVLAALCDDLNTHGAITELRKIYKNGDAHVFRKSAELLGLLTPELGGWIEQDAMLHPTLSDEALRERIISLVWERQDAKTSKNFDRADTIREMLTKAGVVVTDTPEGPAWDVGPDFDPAKLEALK